MNQSALQKEKKFGDEAIKKEWTPSEDDIDAFIDEYNRMEKDGGYQNPDNYNIRQSPWKKYYEIKTKE